MLALQQAPTPILQSLRAQLAPAFANEQQRRFFNCHASEVLYSGAYRAGKSRIGCEKAFWLAKRYPGIPIGIFRKTAASLAASTERTLLHDVIPRSAIVNRNKSQHWYELANGSRIWLFGLDPDPITGLPSKVGSVELGWAFVDEAAEVTELDWSMVKGRLSWPGIPYHQIAAATNPASPKHWLKVRFTPPTEDRVYLHASTFDNPLLPDDYVEDAKRANDDYLKRRYIYGEWVGAEGVIWSLPDNQVKLPETNEFKRVVAGVDWGFVHAFACEVVGQSGTGRLAVIDEVYEKGQTIDHIIPALQYVRERHNVQTFYADPSEPAYILQCQRAGLPMEPANNAVAPGIGAVSMAIGRGMTVAPSCSGLLGELPGYTWAKDRAGGFR
ncbi:MAG TPA: phage terminase large subunit, partial [Chloroflexota bacterium]|nr:phage terminase large subunit [Chloroflexota bacterium]